VERLRSSSAWMSTFTLCCRALVSKPAIFRGVLNGDTSSRLYTHTHTHTHTHTFPRSNYTPGSASERLLSIPPISTRGGFSKMSVIALVTENGARARKRERERGRSMGSFRVRDTRHRSILSCTPWACEILLRRSSRLSTSSSAATTRACRRL